MSKKHKIAPEIKADILRPPAFQNRSSRDPHPREHLRLQPPPSSAACPDRATPCGEPLRQATAACWGSRQRHARAAAAGGRERPGGRGENAVSFYYPLGRGLAVTNDPKTTQRARWPVAHATLYTRSSRRPASMRWGEPLPKRSSTSASVARWIPSGKSPLAVNGGRDTSAPRRYRVSCVILPQGELLLTTVALDAERCGSGAAKSGSEARADAVCRRLQPVVRCGTGVEERPVVPWPRRHAPTGSPVA
jgi:hypothetical protein